MGDQSLVGDPERSAIGSRRVVVRPHVRRVPEGQSLRPDTRRQRARASRGRFGQISAQSRQHGQSLTIFRPLDQRLSEALANVADRRVCCPEGPRERRGCRSRGRATAADPAVLRLVLRASALGRGSGLASFSLISSASRASIRAATLAPWPRASSTRR